MKNLYLEIKKITDTRTLYIYKKQNKKGEKVSFELVLTDSGYKAKNVVPLDE